MKSEDPAALARTIRGQLSLITSHLAELPESTTIDLRKLHIKSLLAQASEQEPQWTVRTLAEHLDDDASDLGRAETLVEVLGIADDLNQSLPGLAIPYDQAAMRRAVRWLAQEFARSAPGHSVEVRVPPFVAVHCISGPKHSRGTPPNVVETDPLTWFRLTTDRISWADAQSAGLLQASGSRSDLSRQLPLTLVSA